MQNQILYVVMIALCLPFLTAQEWGMVPDVSLQGLDDRPINLRSDTATIIFFFDGSYQKNAPILEELNRIAYAFRMRNLRVIGIYSDVEPKGYENKKIDELKGDLKDFQKELYFPLCLDLERDVLHEFGLREERVPVLLVCNASGKICYCEVEKIVYRKIKAWTEYALGFITEEERDELISRQSQFKPESDELVAETKPYISSAIPEPDTTEPDLVDIGEPDTPAVSIGEPDTPGPTLVELPPGTTEPATTPGITPPIASGVPPSAQRKTSAPATQPAAKGEEKSLLPVVATVHLPETFGHTETLGYKPVKWNLTTTVEDALFYTMSDFLIALIPLLIWGWGMVYCLAKTKQYRGMWYGFLGCFGLFLYAAWSLSCRIPFEVCLLSPDLMAWKDAVVRSHYFLQGESSWSNMKQFPSFSWWETRLCFILLFQIALIKGIAGRLKNDQEDA